MREVSVPAPCGQSKSQHRTIEISHEQTHKTDSIRQMKLKSQIRPQKYKYVIPGVKNCPNSMHALDIGHFLREVSEL